MCCKRGSQAIEFAWPHAKNIHLPTHVLDELILGDNTYPCSESSAEKGPTKDVIKTLRVSAFAHPRIYRTLHVNWMNGTQWGWKQDVPSEIMLMNTDILRDRQQS